MRKGSKHRKAARQRRLRKRLARLVGRQVAQAVIAGRCSLREAVAGLSGAERARASALATQLRGEANR